MGKSRVIFRPAMAQKYNSLSIQLLYSFISFLVILVTEFGFLIVVGRVVITFKIKGSLIVMAINFDFNRILNWEFKVLEVYYFWIC